MQFAIGFLLVASVLAAPEDPHARRTHLKNRGILDSLLNTSSCCLALSQVLPNRVSFPASLPYLQSLSSYWDQHEQQTFPACVVLPIAAQEVSTAITLLSTAYIQGKRAGCTFAIRSGGHMPNAGAANIQGGVTIDLQKLNQVAIAADRQSVALGPGSRWGDVYSQLDAQNITVTGGRVATVGVGGLILGGGLSFFSARYGIVCNNVLNYEIVLPSGDIVNANSSSNPDLFKALKGGGNNFGVVTKFTLRSFDQGEFWGGSVTHLSTDANRAALFNAFQFMAKSATYDPYAALIQNFAWTSITGWIIVSNVHYTKPVAKPPIFKPYFDVPAVISTMRIGKLTDFCKEIALVAPGGRRQKFLTFMFKNDAPFMEYFYQRAKVMQQGLVLVPGLVITFTYQPVSEIFLQNQAASGGNVLGLEASDGDLTNVELNAQWVSSLSDSKVMTALYKLLSEGVQEAKSRGIFNDFIYFNYAEKAQKPISSYGSANKAYLQQVSQQYDPNQVFQNAVPGGFKLATS